MNKEITERQIEIIEAAAKILTTSGVSGLTIKSLAKEMAFSESAIYRHFESKEQIILTMLNFVLQNVDSAFIAKSAELKTPVKKLKALFSNQFSFFKKNPHLAVAIFSDGLLEESSQINEQMLKIISTRRKLIEPIIEEGQKQEIFRSDLSADELIHIVMGSVRLLMYKWRIGHFQFDIESEGAKLILSILKLITNGNNEK